MLHNAQHCSSHSVKQSKTERIQARKRNRNADGVRTTKRIKLECLTGKGWLGGGDGGMKTERKRKWERRKGNKTEAKKVASAGKTESCPDLLVGVVPAFVCQSSIQLLHRFDRLPFRLPFGGQCLLHIN